MGDLGIDKTVQFLPEILLRVFGKLETNTILSIRRVSHFWNEVACSVLSNRKSFLVPFSSIPLRVERVDKKKESKSKMIDILKWSGIATRMCNFEESDSDSEDEEVDMPNDLIFDSNNKELFSNWKLTTEILSPHFLNYCANSKISNEVRRLVVLKGNISQAISFLKTANETLPNLRYLKITATKSKLNKEELKSSCEIESLPTIYGIEELEIGGNLLLLAPKLCLQFIRSCVNLKKLILFPSPRTERDCRVLENLFRVLSIMREIVSKLTEFGWYFPIPLDDDIAWPELLKILSSMPFSANLKKLTIGCSRIHLNDAGIFKEILKSSLSALEFRGYVQPFKGLETLASASIDFVDPPDGPEESLEFRQENIMKMRELGLALMGAAKEAERLEKKEKNKLGKPSSAKNPEPQQEVRQGQGQGPEPQPEGNPKDEELDPIYDFIFQNFPLMANVTSIKVLSSNGYSINFFALIRKTPNLLNFLMVNTMQNVKRQDPGLNYFPLPSSFHWDYNPHPRLRSFTLQNQPIPDIYTFASILQSFTCLEHLDIEFSDGQPWFDDDVKTVPTVPSLEWACYQILEQYGESLRVLKLKNEFWLRPKELEGAMASLARIGGLQDLEISWHFLDEVKIKDVTKSLEPFRDSHCNIRVNWYISGRAPLKLNDFEMLRKFARENGIKLEATLIGYPEEKVLATF